MRRRKRCERGAGTTAAFPEAPLNREALPLQKKGGTDTELGGKKQRRDRCKKERKKRAFPR